MTTNMHRIVPDVIPAVAYYRVSGYGRNAETQRSSVRHYAKVHGYDLTSEYADEGYSGALPDRPGLTQFLDAARDPHRPWRIVLCTDLGRLSDETPLLRDIIKNLSALGIIIHTLDEDIHRAAIAELEDVTRDE